MLRANPHAPGGQGRGEVTSSCARVSGRGLPGRPQRPDRAPLAGQAGPCHSREPTSHPPLIHHGQERSCGHQTQESSVFPAHPSWPSVWGLRAPDPRKELGVPGLLVAGPGLTERVQGGPGTGPCPSSVLHLRWGGRGPAAVCWLPALGCDRFTPHRRMARVHTREVTCVARWPGLGLRRFSQADECVPGPRPSAHSGLGHSTTSLLGSLRGREPRGQVSGCLLSPWPGPAPWAAPPQPCPRPQDPLVPSLCPLGHLSTLETWAERHGGLRGPLPPPPRNIVWGDLSGPVCEDLGLFLGHPSQPPMFPLSRRSENFFRGGAQEQQTRKGLQNLLSGCVLKL